MPGVFRNLWGPQQQVARRHAIEQTSVTLGVADYDPTVRGVLTGGNPYQRLRVRDPAFAVVGANQQWARKRLSTNELGLADGDPTVRPPWADGSAYLWPANRQPAAVTGTNAWARLRLNTNDLGLVDADASVKPPWADGEAFYWPAPRQPDAVNATNAWARLRLTSNDLGVADADPTVRAPWADGSAYLWPAPRQTAQVTAANLWALRRLSTNDLGLTDADPTIRPNYQDPHQRRHLDPAYGVQPTLAWARLRLTTNDLGVADQDTSIRPLWQAANPYTLRLGPSPLPAIQANTAQHRAWNASTPVEDSIDFARPNYQDPYQRRRSDPATWSVNAFVQWMRTRTPGYEDSADPTLFVRRVPVVPVPVSPAYFRPRIPVSFDQVVIPDADPLLFPRRHRRWGVEAHSSAYHPRAKFVRFHSLPGRDLDYRLGPPTTGWELEAPELGWRAGPPETARRR